MARRARTVRLVGLAIAAMYAGAVPRAARAEDAVLPSLGLKGLIDFRGAVSSSTRSWENGGLGKTRYGGTAGGDRRALGTIAEATLIAQPQLTWELSGMIQLTATPEAHTSPDLIEAYLQYKPAPNGPWTVRAKAGLFFPPVSLENTALGWTSPFTISSSAIDTWVGEELRTLGGEISVERRSEDLSVSLGAAAFVDNDPTGTLLAWRGWTISDRKAGVFDQLNLAALPFLKIGNLAKQQPYDEPFVEIDRRVGYYINARVSLAEVGSLSVLRYDNRADDHLFSKGQWPWHTAFWSAGVDLDLGDFDVLAQGMTGKTTLVTLPVLGPVAYTDFKAAYGLVSRAWGQHRVSLRADWFKTEGDTLFSEPNDEHGYGLTAAYIFRPAARQRLTLEFLYIDSTHPERAKIGLPTRARESQFQISYRFFL